MTQTPVRPPVGSSAAVSSSFRCAWKPDGLRAAWVHLSGELDLAAVPGFEETLREAQSSSVMVLVDLRDLEFIDCAGLAVLARGHAHARSARKSMVVLRGSGQVDRVLELAGLLHELEVVDLHVPLLPVAGDRSDEPQGR